MWISEYFVYMLQKNKKKEEPTPSRDCKMQGFIANPIAGCKQHPRGGYRLVVCLAAWKSVIYVSFS
jgi:hypothetical protein